MAKEDVPLAQDRLFSLPAFYAEYAPLAAHDGFVDLIYVLRDRGLLTAHCRAFASPFMELAFSFRDNNRDSGHLARTAVIQPSFGHRKRGRAFFGWIIGVKFKPIWSGPLAAETAEVVACRESLARAIGSDPSCSDILDPIDRLLFALSQQQTQQSVDIGNDRSKYRVADLASELDQSVRTLHRRMKKSIGLPPKRFLALERFRRSVYEVGTKDDRLSLIANDLGFADQGHLTREFQRHAGLPPGTFKRAWQGLNGQAVRFVQDMKTPSRLRVAVRPSEIDRI